MSKNDSRSPSALRWLIFVCVSASCAFMIATAVRSSRSDGGDSHVAAGDNLRRLNATKRFDAALRHNRAVHERQRRFGKREDPEEDAPAKEVSLPRSVVSKMNLSTFKHASFEVSDETARLLELSPHEVKKIEAEAIRMLSDIQWVEKEKAVLVTEEDGSQFYEIPGFAEEGDELRAQFYENLRETLGNDRALIIAESTKSTFSHFGGAKQEISIYFEEKLNKGAGAWLFEHKVLVPDNPSQGQIEISAMDREWIQTRFGHLIREEEE